MIKLMICGRRRAGMTRRMLSSHLRTIHGPMVCAPPQDAGVLPVRYVQNHVFDGTHGAGRALDRDFVTQLWFHSMQDVIAGRSTAYYRDHLEPDEWRFVDQETVMAMPVRESELIRGPQGDAPFTGFVFAKAVAGREQEFLDAWRAARQDVLAEAPDRPLAQVENLPRHADAANLADIVDEFAYASADAAYGLIPQVEAVLSRVGDACDASSCFVLLAEQFSSARILRGMAVSDG